MPDKQNNRNYLHKYIYIYTCTLVNEIVNLILNFYSQSNNTITKIIDSIGLSI